MASKGTVMKRTMIVIVLVSAVLLTAGAVCAIPSVYPDGTTVYEPTMIAPGLVMFVAPAKNSVMLVNKQGDVCGSWPARSGVSFFLAEPVGNGNILALSEQIMLELDWQNNIVWQYEMMEDAWFHHDLQRLQNGNTLILCAKSKQNIPYISSSKLVYDGYIIEVDPSGAIVWQWRTCERFDEFLFDETARQLIAETGRDWAHTNSIQALPANSLDDARFAEGNILVSQRATNIVFVIDKATGAIVWLIKDLTIGQHHAYMIGEGMPGAGNVTIFDNGGNIGYPKQYRNFSRVVEIDPLSSQIVWSYDATKSGCKMHTFYSEAISSCQRLQNGNTLIVEGMNGRIFEVRQDGTLVWEYINPYREPRLGGNGVYRAMMVDAAWLP